MGVGVADASYSQHDQVPIWFWVIAVAAVLWNAMGVFNFAMTYLSPAYLEQMTDVQRAYFTSFPIWYELIWAGTVFSAFFASALLLLRNRWAFLGFAVTIALYVVSGFYHFGLRDGLAVMGTGGAVFSLVLAASLVGLWVFSRLMLQRGVLR